MIHDLKLGTATAPPYYVDAMYKTVLGAVYDSTIQGYIVPCDTQLNITLVFGSVRTEYFEHNANSFRHIQE